ncbi:transcriptional regulator [Streptomyces litmocidini]|uniref:helix-turn-helix domain-containing protein n=1 Tax=Streptomyces litmocidini TaxID=67318 RepID=UPI00167CD432|nr:helix-turn-helix domain-containing protein [Streptomyces litmocidini]GGV20477.1 transcriptional regulator [Streptomyces litmocidini]
MPNPQSPSPSTTAAALRALAQPLRLRIFHALAAHEAATATVLAEELGQKVPLVSYHLGQLHRYGLAEEAPNARGDGRERWWQVRQSGLRFSDQDLTAEPGGEAAAKTLRQTLLARHIEILEGHLQTQTVHDPATESHSFSSDMTLRLTTEQLGDLHAEFTALLDRYSEQQAAPGDGERFVVLVHGIPYQP